MNLITSLLLPLTPLTIASPLTTASPPPHRIPTVHESAIQARRILHLTPLGTLSTVFPSHPPSTHDSRPPTVANTPIGLTDYIADCEPSTGNPTLLALPIATSFKNAAAGSNISLSLRWHPPTDGSRSSHAYSAAALPRFSLVGTLEALSDDEVRAADVAACFVRAHPDARAWLPGNRIHVSRWARLRVREVYWVGGIPHRAFIGWIPAGEWAGVTREEIEGCRLPGEEREERGGGWWAWLMGKGEAEREAEVVVGEEVVEM